MASLCCSTVFNILAGSSHGTELLLTSCGSLVRNWCNNSWSLAVYQYLAWLEQVVVSVGECTQLGTLQGAAITYESHLAKQTAKA